MLLGLSLVDNFKLKFDLFFVRLISHCVKCILHNFVEVEELIKKFKGSSLVLGQIQHVTDQVAQHLSREFGVQQQPIEFVEERTLKKVLLFDFFQPFVVDINDAFKFLVLAAQHLHFHFQLIVLRLQLPILFLQLDLV